MITLHLCEIAYSSRSEGFPLLSSDLLKLSIDMLFSYFIQVTMLVYMNLFTCECERLDRDVLVFLLEAR